MASKSFMANGLPITVKRDCSLPPGFGLTDTYDIYSVKFGNGDWISVRRAINSSLRSDVRNAVVEACQNLYEEAL